MSKIILDERYIIPFFSKKLEYKSESNISENKKFEKGAIYKLTSTECDGFKMPIKKYKYVDSITEVDGINIDSVIMKEIDGGSSTIFSLTKADCHNLGITFDDKLQLFPKNMNWERVIDETVSNNVNNMTFNPEDMSTYPVDYLDKTIHFMTIKLSSFNMTHNGNLILPNGQVLDDMIFTNNGIKRKCTFSDVFKVKVKKNIGVIHDFDNQFLATNTQVPYRVITHIISRPSVINNEIDRCGNIYIEICLEQRIKGRLVGIQPTLFSNMSFNEVFNIEYSKNNIKNEPLENITEETWYPTQYDVANLRLQEFMYKYRGRLPDYLRGFHAYKIF